MKKNIVTFLLVVMLALLIAGTVYAGRIPSDWKDGGPNPRATATPANWVTPTRLR